MAALLSQPAMGRRWKSTIGNADMTEPYNWIPTTPPKSSHSPTTSGTTSLTMNATLTLTDDPPTTDHEVDAGMCPGPLTFRNRLLPTRQPQPLQLPARPAQPSLVVDSDTQITATGVAPDDGGSQLHPTIGGTGLEVPAGLDGLTVPTSRP